MEYTNTGTQRWLRPWPMMQKNGVYADERMIGTKDWTTMEYDKDEKNNKDHRSGRQPPPATPSDPPPSGQAEALGMREKRKEEREWRGNGLYLCSSGSLETWWLGGSVWFIAGHHHEVVQEVVYHQLTWSPDGALRWTQTAIPGLWLVGTWALLCPINEWQTWVVECAIDTGSSVV